MVSRSIGLAFTTTSELLLFSATTRTRLGFTPAGSRRRRRRRVVPPSRPPPPPSSARQSAAAAARPPRPPPGCCCCCGPLKISVIVAAASSAGTFLSFRYLEQVLVRLGARAVESGHLHEHVERHRVFALEDQLVADHLDDDGLLVGLGIDDLGAMYL